MRASHLIFSALALVALSGCEDPAKGKTKAVTTEATTVSPAALTDGKGGVQYDFDASNSKIEWVGSKVTAKHEGSFKKFNGMVSLVDQTPEKSSVKVDIETDSIHTGDGEKLLTHLRGPDFFDVAKFPKASFASTEIKKGSDKGGTHTVTGNLTLRGVTKSITFPTTIKITPSGVDVNAEFSINRKDFGIVYAGKADDLIRDDVVIKLTIASQKKS